MESRDHATCLPLAGRPGLARGLRRPGRLLACGLSLALLGLLASPAAAITENRKKAEALFLEGAKAYRAGDLKTAAAKLEEAEALDTSPMLLFNLGMIYDKQQDVPNAVRCYKAYLMSEPPDANFVRLRLGQLDAKAIAALDQELAAAKAAGIKPGSKLRGAKDPVAPVVPVATPTSPKATGGGGKIRLLTWALLGTGVAALGAGSAFGVLANGAVDDFDAATVRAKAQEAKDSAESHALIANVGFGVGGAALAAGAVLLVLDLTSGGGEPAPGSGGDCLARWSLQPALGPGEAGFLFSRSF
ncbi:MAG: hypothetical protein RBU45_12420 [Myxococcota bacterium]|nr:hypothetical protein [Myxococcota bacterium]